MSPPDRGESLEQTPRSFGYRMPGEWAPHTATWIAWPHERSDWPGRFSAIPEVYVGIVEELARGESVEIIVESSEAEAGVKRALRGADLPLDRLRFHRWPTDRSWLRDSGPTFVVRPESARQPGSVGGVRWRFNGWAKYDNWRRDATVAQRIVRVAGRPSWVPRLNGRRVVLEGGAIDANGRGFLLTTEECLLSSEQVRNPGMTRGQYEEVFSRYLGVDSVLWLPRGIAGDDTHGHVDDVARFVSPTTIVAPLEPEPADENHASLAENRERLQEWAYERRSLRRVVELPMPDPVRFRGRRLPASYANFYIANASVLVPTFDDPHDRAALSVLRSEFPGRRVVGIPCKDLIVGLGTLHCLTQPEFSTGAEPS